MDFAKFGVLVVNKGKWGHQQIINPNYIENLYDETFNLTKNNQYSDAYGMLWYKSQRTFGTINWTIFMLQEMEETS